MTSPRSALIYVRISKDRTGAGLGVERQEGDCRRLAERLGCVVDRVFVDNDVTAMHGSRPAYSELVEVLSRGGSLIVIAWHSDRLHRQPRELEAFMDVVLQHNIEVHFVQSGPIDLTTPSGRLNARIAGAVASHESEHKAQRNRSARLQIAQRGLWQGGTRPFGYEPDGVTVRPDEAAAIRRAYDILLSGGSLRSVVRLFNVELRLPTVRSGGVWSGNTMKLMLLRERNAGKSVFNGEIVADGQWPAIVTLEELEALRHLLSDPRRASQRGSSPRWIGSLIYRCGLCGSGLVVGTTGSPSRPSYRCRATKTSGGYHVSRSAPKLDAWVEEMLLRRLEDDVLRERYLKPRGGVDVLELRRRLAALEKSGRAMSRRLGQELITDGEYEEFIVENRAKVKSVTMELAQATQHSAVVQLLSSNDLRGTWKGYLLEQRRAVLREALLVTVFPSGPTGPRFDTSHIQLTWL